MKIASLVTTCDRPDALERTLPQVIALGAMVLVVDDGSQDDVADRNEYICRTARPEAPDDVHYLRFPHRRGLAGAWNAGLSYIMADPDVDAISYVQDDCEIDPLLLEVGAELLTKFPGSVFTGNHAKEHPILGWAEYNGIRVARKPHCRATHMMATRKGWERVMPIRSRGLGLPGLPPGVTPAEAAAKGIRGRGSDTDWWVTRDAPHKLPTICVPGLVRIFLWEAKDSLWGNRQVSGPDDPLTRQHIAGWLKAREKAHG